MSSSSSSPSSLAAAAPFEIGYEKAHYLLAARNVFGEAYGPAEDVYVTLDRYWPAFIMIFSFVLYWFVLFPHVFPLLRKVDAKTLKVWRDRHNIVLFFYSAFCCGATFLFLYQDNQLTSWTTLLCKPTERTWLRPLDVTFILSKLYEQIDTAFIIALSTRPVGFLHKYHHATTFWLFLFVTCIPSGEKLGMLLNGFVHTLMYSHYWRSWPSFLVPVITALQIAQLATVTAAWHLTPSVCPDIRQARAVSEMPWEFYTPYTMVPVFLILFITFFVNRFCPRVSQRISHAFMGKSVSGDSGYKNK
jgi:hypothetical protein